MRLDKIKKLLAMEGQSFYTISNNIIVLFMLDSEMLRLVLLKPLIAVIDADIGRARYNWVFEELSEAVRSGVWKTGV